MAFSSGPARLSDGPINRVTSLSDVASVAGARPLSTDIVVTGASDDSRTISPGDLYVALPGEHVHGLDFEEQALSRGAVAALSDRPGDRLPTIVVDDPRRIAGPVSARIYGDPSPSLDVYGVTGTNGKTSTTYLLAAALEACGDTMGTVTGISISGPEVKIASDRTTPEAAVLQRTLAEFRDSGVTSVAMEVSSHAVTHRRIDGTFFAVAGFTNLSRDHLDLHGSMERYFETKSELFTPGRTGAAAVGIDDVYGRRLVTSTEIPCWTWSIGDRDADIVAEEIECTADGTRFTARTPHGDVAVHLELLGHHQVSNALAALAMCAAAGKDLEAAAEGLSTLTGVPGRLEVVDVGQPFLALVDYMHNTAGQRRSLDYLRTLTASRLIVVIGATGDRDPGKRFPLGSVAAELADVVVVTDESPYSEDADTVRAEVAAGAIAGNCAEVVVIADRQNAFDVAVDLAVPGDVVVVTGRGCDNKQVFGTEVRTFDDRVRLRHALTGRRQPRSSDHPV